MNSAPPPLRLFVAIPLPPPLAQHIAEIEECLCPRLATLRWVRPEDAHLTLAFIGAVPAS